MEDAHLRVEGRQGISSSTNEDCRMGMLAVNLEALIARCRETVAECERLDSIDGNADVLEHLCAEVIEIDDCIVAYPVSTLAEVHLKANHLLQMLDRGVDDFNGNGCFRSLLHSLSGDSAQT